MMNENFGSTFCRHQFTDPKQGFLFSKSTFFADEIDALELNSRKTLNPDGEPGRFY